MVIYLPPYSPDFNPCEELFSYIKYYLKDHNLIFGCMDEPLEILKSGFNSATQDMVIDSIAITSLLKFFDVTQYGCMHFLIFFI